MEMCETKFVEVFFQEYTDVITKNFKIFLDNDLYIDLIFICNDKKKIRAHQIVVGSLSRFLYNILVENQKDIKGKVAYICMPDINSGIMEQIIYFIYTGQVTLNTKNLKEFHENMILLGMPSFSFTATNEVSKATNLTKIINVNNNLINKAISSNKESTKQVFTYGQQNFNSKQLSDILENIVMFNLLKDNSHYLKSIALFT